MCGNVGTWVCMKNALIKFLCCFIPFRSVRRRFRRWGKRKPWKNNLIEIVKKDGRRVRVKRVRGCKFVFRGDNNHVVLYEPLGNLELHVAVSSGVYIELHSSTVYQRKIKVIKSNAETCTNRLVIGENFSSTNFVIIDFCAGTGNVEIGSNCLFAEGVLWTGDWHTVYDADTGAVLNNNQDIRIGNHVWVAVNVLIFKGTVISDDTVVAARSLVNKQFNQSNVVIAGVPAKIVKENINWDACAPHKFAEKNKLS